YPKIPKWEAGPMDNNLTRKFEPSCPRQLVFLFSFLVAASVLPLKAHASSTTLPRRAFRSGEEMLQILEPISKATRHSIITLNVEGKRAALGTVIDTNGLVLTKASEVNKGKLTCW